MRQGWKHSIGILGKLNINYKFKNPELYDLAMTHKSSSKLENNERMEFLGDAVLDLVITDFIYKNYPDLPEGDLAKLRADIVCAASLVQIAEELDLAPALELGKGEVPQPSILTDAVEALIAAIYLDSGYEVTQSLILNWFEEQIEEAASNPGTSDYKSRLQELAAKIFDEAPIYELESAGPDHEKSFYASVMISDKKWGRGEGHTKKEATQIAAKEAFQALEKDSSNEQSKVHN